MVQKKKLLEGTLKFFLIRSLQKKKFGPQCTVVGTFAVWPFLEIDMDHGAAWNPCPSVTEDCRVMGLEFQLREIMSTEEGQCQMKN